VAEQACERYSSVRTARQRDQSAKLHSLLDAKAILRAVDGIGRGTISTPTDPAGPSSYYRYTRRQILLLVHQQAEHVLELGCAESALAATVKVRTGATVWGIESNPQTVERTRTVIRRVLIGCARTQIVVLCQPALDPTIGGCANMRALPLDEQAQQVRI
jgi:hypothetical protein